MTYAQPVVPDGYRGVFAQCREELMQAIANWDFQQAFLALNPNYVGNRSVELVPQWPDARLDEIQLSRGGTMEKPIISIVLFHNYQRLRSIGGITQLYGSSPPAEGMERHAVRVYPTYLVTAWADHQLGGSEMAEVLAGHIYACVFANRNRLPTFRHLQTSDAKGARDERPGVWAVSIQVKGDALITADVPVNP